MKSRAPGIQRTGQPKCAQFTENAMNSRSAVRRSHAAVLAVMAAQGSGEASTRLTFVVSPILKSAILPTARQTMGLFCRSGARVKPTIGTASPPHPAPSPTQTRARKRRRSGDGGASASRCRSRSPGGSLLRVMHNLSDPLPKGVKQQRAADEDEDERTDEAPRAERQAEGQKGRRRRGRGQALGRKGVPTGGDGPLIFAHDAPSAEAWGSP